jgi:hypothetical protein
MALRVSSGDGEVLIEIRESDLLAGVSMNGFFKGRDAILSKVAANRPHGSEVRVAAVAAQDRQIPGRLAASYGGWLFSSTESAAPMPTSDGSHRLSTGADRMKLLVARALSRLPWAACRSGERLSPRILEARHVAKASFPAAGRRA